MGVTVKKGNSIYHVRGNVNEWNISAGESWKHKKTAIMERDTLTVYKADAATGFRNIAEWVEWKN